MAGLKYWVWLSEVKGLTNRSKLLLLDYFGTPENVYYADEDEYRLVEGIEPRQIALLAGNPRMARQVGWALHKNPDPANIPCHRVVRRDGDISGYRWGVERKRELLRREERD